MRIKPSVKIKSLPSGPQGLAGSVVGPNTNTDNYIPQWDGLNSKVLKNGVKKSTDGTLSENSDNSIPTEKAVKTYAQPLLGFTPENSANKENTTLDTSVTKYPTNRLVKEYVDDLIPLDAPAFQGTLGGELTGIKTIVQSYNSGSITVGSNRLTVTEAGRYFVHAQQLVATGAGAACYFYIRKNGNNVAYGWCGTTQQQDLLASCVVDMGIGDYIDIYITGGSTVWGGGHSSLAMYKLTNGAKGDQGEQGPAGGLDGPMPYIHLGMSAAQTVDVGTTIAFDTVRKSNTLTRNGFGINVKAGKTYRLQAYVNLNSDATGSMYVGCKFYDNTNAIGEIFYSNTPAAVNHGMKAPGFMFYTPAVDSILYVKVADDNIGAGTINHTWNTSFIVEQVVGMKGDKGDTGDVSVSDIVFEGWTNVSAFQNSWVNFGTPWQEASFCKDALGFVHLRGLIKNGTISGSLPAFTLPVGYRPDATYGQRWPVVANNAFGAVNIFSDGRVCVEVGSNVYVFLDSITFKAV